MYFFIKLRALFPLTDEDMRSWRRSRYGKIISPYLRGDNLDGGECDFPQY